MRLVEFSQTEITPEQLVELDKYIDRLFAAVGLDVEFSYHFRQRLRDERNKKPITVNELRRMFKKVHRQMRKGRDLVELGPDAQAVLKDLSTDINIPFVINWDTRNNEFDLVAKTIIRKHDFATSNDILTVEHKQHK